MSTFGYEFKYMKQSVEYVYGFIYKLQIMGNPCEDPAFVYVDNKSVFTDTSVPAYTLKNNMNILSYYFFRD